MQQEEERLAALQAEALKQVPAGGLGSVGAAAADRLARALEALWLNLSVRAKYSQLLSAAERLGLHRAQIPAALLKVPSVIPGCEYKCSFTESSRGACGLAECTLQSHGFCQHAHVHGKQCCHAHCKL